MLYFPHPRVRYGMRDVKIVIGGCARMVRTVTKNERHAAVCADRPRTPSDDDFYGQVLVVRLQKHQLRMRRRCEEARCYSNRYNPSIKQYKDSHMCNNSGQFFVHMFVYCSSRSTAHVWNTSAERTTSARFPRCRVRVRITHAESITQV